MLKINFIIIAILIIMLPAFSEPQTAEQWFKEGIVSIEETNYENALYCFEKAIKLKPYYVDAWYKKGVALYKINGKTTDMEIKCYDKALSINPGYHKVWYAKGWAVFEEGKIEEAKKCYNKAVKLSPGSNYSWYYTPSSEAEVIKKDLSSLYKGVLNIDYLASSGEWAMVWFTVKDSYGTGDYCILIKNNNGKWETVTGTSSDATTDFLKNMVVPSDKWNKLLGENSIKKNKPLMDFLHEKLPSCYCEYIIYEDKWALVSLRYIKTETEGIALVKYENGSWKLITSGGGPMSKEELIERGVSSEAAEKLINR